MSTRPATREPSSSPVGHERSRSETSSSVVEDQAGRRATFQRIWPGRSPFPEGATDVANVIARTTLPGDPAAARPYSEERAAYVLDTAGVGLWELDLATARLTCSASMASLFGVRLDETPRTAEDFVALILPDDRQTATDFLTGPRQVATDCHAEFRVLRPEGGTRWVDGHARLFRDATGRPVRLMGIATDIDDRKVLESQLARAQKIAAVGQLTAGLAHDLNNLLTVILAYSGLVLGTFGPDDPRRADMQQVMKAGHQAGGLTRQLLAFIRKRGGKATTFDLNALVTDMLEMLGHLLGSDIELVSALAPGLPAVWADPGQVEQLLMNLVINARDAMPSGGRLTVGTAPADVAGESVSAIAGVRSGTYVVLAVSDTGAGMGEETRSHLFEPFFTTKVDGTGLGLAVVRGIVTQSGGYVRVRSEVGKGTTFKVFLPSATLSDRDGLSASSRSGSSNGHGDLRDALRT